MERSGVRETERLEGLESLGVKQIDPKMPCVQMRPIQ